ncbi:MAG: HAD family hydrolase [Oscillospiraceae bacterium]|nr:HAD family hydrolase [Oscillospiraceae bacterium]
MKLTTVLFDLDGTLLPMDQDEFVKYYLGLLGKKLAPYGYDPRVLAGNIWAGTAAMVKNDGSCTNEEVFWTKFSEFYTENVRKDEPIFREFYENEFIGAKAACGFNPKAAEAVAAIKARGLRVVLATNPLFPAVATENRIRWAGLTPQTFELYTTYENSSRCKPNPGYYQDILDRLGVCAEECLMVGNDAIEDTAAGKLGIKVFLLTDCLINKDQRDLSGYPQGSFDELLAYIKTL